MDNVVLKLNRGVESTAAAPEIKKAYRKAALKHHPDKVVVLSKRVGFGSSWVFLQVEA